LKRETCARVLLANSREKKKSKKRSSVIAKKSDKNFSIFSRRIYVRSRLLLLFFFVVVVVVGVVVENDDIACQNMARGELAARLISLTRDGSEPFRCFSLSFSFLTFICLKLLSLSRDSARFRFLSPNCRE